MPFVPNKLGVVKVPGKLKDHEMVSPFFSPRSSSTRATSASEFELGGWFRQTRRTKASLARFNFSHFMNLY